MSEWTKRYTAVVAATRHGNLAKASERKCERCSKQAAHRHHDDYSRPLDVNYFCNKHHRRRHAELGWGIGGRKKSPPKLLRPKYQPGYLKLLDIQPFDFVYVDGTISNVSLMAYHASRNTTARFKCFTADDDAVVVFRIR